MRTATKFFGELEHDSEDTILFPGGLPGFEALRDFLMLRPGGWEPLAFLQSRERSEVCFVLLPVDTIVPGYELRILDDDLLRLGFALEDSAKLSSWAIITLLEGEPASANLLAPVLISPAHRRAVQAVRDDTRYSATHPLEQGASPCS